MLNKFGQCASSSCAAKSSPWKVWFNVSSRKSWYINTSVFCYIIRIFQEQEGLEGCSVSLTLPSVLTWSTWPWWPAPCAGPGPTSSHSCNPRVWAPRYHKTTQLAAGSRALSSVKQTQALGTAQGGNWRPIIYLQCFLMEHCALIMEMRIYFARF